MSTCEIGPNGGAGCGETEMLWAHGKWYSPHFRGSHWSRVKHTPKAKANDSGLTESMTEEQVRAQLKVVNEAMRDAR